MIDDNWSLVEPPKPGAGGARVAQALLTRDTCGWWVSRHDEGGKMVSKKPLAHVSSLRDNWLYRAAFYPPKLPRNPAAEDSPVTTIVDHHQVHCRRRACQLETIPCRR